MNSTGDSSSDANVSDSTVVRLLLSEVEASIRSLELLRQHADRLGDDAIQLIESATAECRRRLDRKELHVCVVGETKVGKSTFLNALLGNRVLGVAVRECTGAVTMLRWGPRPQYEVRLTNGEIERFEDVCPDHYDEIRARLDESEQQIATCASLAGTLPDIIEAMKVSIEHERQLLPTLHDTVSASEAAAKESHEKLGDAEEELRQHEARLLAASAKVPWCYRTIGRWWQIWTWLPRRFYTAFEKPEWKTHWNELQKYVVEQEGVHDLGRAAATSRQQSVAARKEVAECVSREARLREELTRLEDQHGGLPAEHERWSSVRMEDAQHLARHTAERLERFHEAIKELTDMQRRGADVASLCVTYPASMLPAGLVVIDTPGVNTDSAINRERGWEVIRKEADGCIVLSDIQQPVGISTREFVGALREIVPHLILVLTKVDRALDSAPRGGDATPEEQVDEARRLGESRFAEDIGRSNGEIISFATSAEQVLKQNPEAVERFAADIRRLMTLLQTERALIVASRCATAIRRLMSDIYGVHERAESEYRERIAALEAQQIGDPDDYCTARLAEVAGRLRAGARATVESGAGALRGWADGTKRAAADSIEGAADLSALKLVIERLCKDASTTGRKAKQCVDDAMGDVQRRLFDEVEPPILQALQERYQIVGSLTGSASKRVGVHRVSVRASDIGSAIARSVQESLNQSMSGKNAGIAGGAAAGAVIGTGLLPGVGTVLGGLIGGAIGTMLGPKLKEIKARCAAHVYSAIEAAAEAATKDIFAREERLARDMGQALHKSLRVEVRNYRAWIAKIIEEHVQQVTAERAKFSHLLQVRGALAEHDTRLRNMQQSVAEESRGLCRETPRSLAIQVVVPSNKPIASTSTIAGDAL